MTGRGRPELPAEELRSALIGVRVKPAERDLIREAADRADKSMSDWAREILVAAAKRAAAAAAGKRKRRPKR